MKQIIIAGTGLPELIPLVEDFCGKHKNMRFIGFVDDNLDNANRDLYGHEFLGSFEVISKMKDTYTVNSICRTTEVRRKSTERLIGLNAKFLNLIHPSVDNYTKSIGLGNIIDRKSLLQKGSVVGSQNVMLTNVTIGHDAYIGDYNFFGHNCVCNGGVKILGGCFLAANSSIAPNVTIGKNCKVSLNTPVFSEVAPGKTVTLRTPVSI